MCSQQKEMDSKAGVNFINVLCAHFLYESAFFGKIVSTEKLCKRLLYEKHVRLMLLKLTPGRKMLLKLHLEIDFARIKTYS
jgi:hypothetical protein